MTIKLIGGGGGSFITKFASPTVVVSSGATGTYITLTPPSGQKVRLTSLYSDGAAQTNLTSVDVNSVTVVTDVLLAQSAATPDSGEFAIGNAAPNQESIIGQADEVIEIKTNVATSQGTRYSYQFGI